MRIPGVAWVALIMALIGWIQGDWFAGERWVPLVVLALDFIAKGLQIYWPSEERARSVEQPSLWTVLWG